MNKAKRLTKKTVLENLKTGELKGANLQGLSLKNTNLEGAILQNADLTGINLSGANLKSADLRGACLKKANLTKTDFTGAQLGGADLTKAKLIDTLFENVKAQNCKFTDATLSKIVIRQSNLEGVDLSRIVAPGCFIESTQMRKAILVEAEISESKIVDTDMTDADITSGYIFNSHLENVLAVNCKAVKTDFSFSSLNNVQFTRADLKKANFTASNFLEVDFQDANVQAARMKSTKGLSDQNREELKEKGALVSNSLLMLLERIKSLSRRTIIFLAFCLLLVFAFVAYVFAFKTDSIELAYNEYILNLPKPYQGTSPVDPGVTILCVGDSHTSGEGLEKHLDYPSQLEALLNMKHPDPGFRVKNLGVSGSNSSQAANRLFAALNQLKTGENEIIWVIFSCGKNNQHQLMQASFLPEEVRNNEELIFPYMLQNKDTFRFSPLTVSNLKKLIQNKTSPLNTNWGQVIDHHQNSEQALLNQWIKSDMTSILETLNERKIKLILMNYYQPISWLDSSYHKFSKENDIPFISITNFRLPGNLDALKPYSKDFRPNRYGNRIIAELIYKTLSARGMLHFDKTALQTENPKNNQEKAEGKVSLSPNDQSVEP